MSKTIKNNLFRFVTLRNPQLIDKKEEKPGFVFHPDETSGEFFSAISDVIESERQATLLDASSSFSALKTRVEARSVNEGLYLFSSWLMRHKNTLTFSEIKNNSEGVEVLSPQQELLVWDNLIYQTIEKKSTYVREAMIQLLITNQFLKAFITFSEGLSDDITFTEDQEKEFTRRANASVVISRKLVSNPDVEKPNSRRGFTEAQEKAIDNAMEVALAKETIEKQTSLMQELHNVEKQYNIDTKKTYEKALNGHQKEVEELIANTEPVIIEKIDKETGETSQIKTYPNLTIPEFRFEKTDPINKEYLSGKLTKESARLFDALGLELNEDFPQVYKQITENLKSANETVYKNSGRVSKTAKIGGVSMRVPTSQLPTTPYCFSVRPGIALFNESNVYMYLATASHTEVISATYQLTSNANTNITYSGNQVRRVHGGGVSEHLGLILFEEGLAALTGEFTLEGEFTLNNGDTITFEVNNLLFQSGARPVAGCATIKSDNPPAEPAEPQTLFGVTNLGIADFRRVEQEVCCYVPGEVSHIENVMAREYKERSTRNLISVETTTEEITEKEVERLTDTTTTERNEMQSEVASVINEDKSKSYGANASVSGKLLGGSFSAGGYLDVASSSSSSNSNSQAQSYAQEMTERAMERIVQKVSRKRTSRVLKEFEENNKHGFDNTKGDKHVTGVFRWVDKIYKNRLINYGKRLMYEFAIPEPSRFFKEAIYKQIENEEIDSEYVMPEKPEDPSSIGLHSAASITESNYQSIASKYEADVSAPIDQYIKIGKAFAKDNQSYNAIGYANNEIKIPDGYSASQGTVRWSVIVKDNSNKHLSIALGDYRQTVIGGSGSTSFYNFSDKYKDNIPFSYGSWEVHSGHFSVTIDCVRTKEAYEQWRNETYTAIMDAYQQKLDAFNDAVTADEAFTPTDQEKLKFNPSFNRSVERKELKRIAIDLLTEPYGINLSDNDYKPGSKTTVDKTLAFQNRASAAKFFEQAFDWDIMAYVFYPYFYGKQSDWTALFQEQDAADPIFQAFLQSGMSRTVVPVRPGFEDAVNWYMETGEIWNGEGVVLDQENDLYVSIAEELQTVEGEVEDTWETRLPTALTILQAGSIGLDIQGLPCNTDCDDFALFDSDGNPVLDQDGNQVTENPIVQTDTLIGGEDPDAETLEDQLRRVESRMVENVDIENGYLKLTTDDKERQIVAQISVEAIKRAIDETSTMTK